MSVGNIARRVTSLLGLTASVAKLNQLDDNTFTAAAFAQDHGAAATDELVNVCYGTSTPPTANTTTIGSLYIKYVA